MLASPSGAVVEARARLKNQHIAFASPDPGVLPSGCKASPGSGQTSKARSPGRIAGSILVILLAATIPLPAAGAGGPARVSLIHADIVVLVFDGSGLLDPESIRSLLDSWLKPGYPVNVNVSGVNVTIEYRFNVTVASVPEAYREALTRALEGMYESHGVPGWLPQNATGYAGPVAWIDLGKAYRVIRRASLEASFALGFNGYDEVVAIIGDLDGYGRVYYFNSTYEYAPAGRVGFTGFRGLAGPGVFTFYDLYSIAAPWPSGPARRELGGVPVDPSSDPPLPLLRDPNLYAAKLVYGHLLYHYVGALDARIRVECPSSLEVLMVILDFGGNGEAAGEIYLQTLKGVGELERLAVSFAPWVSVNVSVEVMKASRGLRASYTVDSTGSAAFEYSKTYKALSELASNLSKSLQTPLLGPECLGSRCLWVFFILATPEPSYFTEGGSFNFTGFSAGAWGATTYPGWNGRVLRAGIPRVAAHELGHSLGLSHPFNYNNSIWWLMDETLSVMSYMDFAPAMLGGVNVKEAGALAAACTAALAARLNTQTPLEPLPAWAHPRDHVTLAFLAFGGAENTGSQGRLPANVPLATILHAASLLSVLAFRVPPRPASSTLSNRRSRSSRVCSGPPGT